MLLKYINVFHYVSACFNVRSESGQDEESGKFESWNLVTGPDRGDGGWCLETLFNDWGIFLVQLRFWSCFFCLML